MHWRWRELIAIKGNAYYLVTQSTLKPYMLQSTVCCSAPRPPKGVQDWHEYVYMFMILFWISWHKASPEETFPWKQQRSPRRYQSNSHLRFRNCKLRTQTKPRLTQQGFFTHVFQLSRQFLIVNQSTRVPFSTQLLSNITFFRTSPLTNYFHLFSFPFLFSP